MKPKLTLNTLKKAAEAFCKKESKHKNIDLFGVTDGKIIDGTYTKLIR